LGPLAALESWSKGYHPRRPGPPRGNPAANRSKGTLLLPSGVKTSQKLTTLPKKESDGRHRPAPNLGTVGGQSEASSPADYRIQTQLTLKKTHQDSARSIRRGKWGAHKPLETSESQRETLICENFLNDVLSVKKEVRPDEAPTQITQDQRVIFPEITRR